MLQLPVMKNRAALLILYLLTAASASCMEISLYEAERLALSSSSEIRNAGEQLALAALKNNLDLRSFLPSLSVNFSSGRQININAPDSDSVRMEINLTQPVFDGGRTFKMRELTEIQLGIQAAALEQQAEQIRDRIWQLFYSLLLNREKLKLQRELLELTVNQLTVAFKKLQLGKLTELDYLEATIEVQNMEIDILDTESSERTLVQDFSLATGFDPWHFESDPLTLDGKLEREYEGMPLWTDDYPYYTEKAFLENNSLRQKLVELNQKRTEYALLKTGFIPRISIDSSFYVQGTKLPMQEPGFSLSLVIDFPWSKMPSNVTAGGGMQSDNQISGSISNGLEILPSLDYMVNEKAAAHKLKQSSQALSDQRQALERQIRTMLEQLEHERLRMTIRRNTQSLREKRLQILETRSRMGEVSELDLLQVRIDFYQEEIGIREAVLSLMKGEREFEKLLGAEFGSLSGLADTIFYKDSR